MPSNNPINPTAPVLITKSPTPANIVGLVTDVDNGLGNLQSIIGNVGEGMVLTDEARTNAIEFLNNAKEGLPVNDGQLHIIETLLSRLSVDTAINSKDVVDLQTLATELNPTINDIQNGEVILNQPTGEQMPSLIPDNAIGSLSKVIIQKEKNSMTGTIESLSNLANYLDKSNLKKFANEVDNISNNTLHIKTAQYVGIQGYWIRNDRCWKNCYRQKRSGKPEMPAQEVWNECHQEYLESINNDTSGWNKYAQYNPKIKIASKDLTNKILNKEKENFNNIVKQKIEQGWSIGNAVFDTIQSSQDQYTSAMIQNATKLADIAVKLNKSGYDTLGKYAISASEQMTKEAQFGANLWNPKNWGQGIKERFNQFTGGADPRLMTQRFSRILNAVQSLRTRFPEDLSSINDPNMEAQAQSAFIKLKDDIGKELPILEKMSRTDVNAGKMFQQILPAFQNFSKIVATPHIVNQPGKLNAPGEKPRSRRIALDNLANVISQAIGVSNEAFQTQLPQQQVTPEAAETQAEYTQPSGSIDLPEGAVEGAKGIEYPVSPEGPGMAQESVSPGVDQILKTVNNMPLKEMESFLSQVNYLTNQKRQDAIKGQGIQTASSKTIKKLIKNILKKQ